MTVTARMIARDCATPRTQCCREFSESELDALDVFTRYTGGKQYSFIKEKALERAVTALGEELHSQYLLSYMPNNLSEGGFHEIKVVVNRPNLEVRTRPGYWVAGRPE